MNYLKEILGQAIGEELEKAKNFGEKIRIPQVTKKRVMFAIVFSLLCMSFFSAPPMFLIVAVIGIVRIIRTTPEKEIAQLSYMFPNDSFSDIIRKNNRPSYSQKEMIAIASAVLCAAASLCIFVSYNFDFKTEVKYRRVASGYELASYTRACYDFEDELTVPDTHNGLPVVSIGNSAFDGAPLKKITVPSSVTKIDSGAFKNCKRLEYVNLSDNITFMGGECFLNCKSLKSITIPKGTTIIKGNSFQNCSSLVRVILHDKVTEIHAYAFDGCSSLENIILPSKITKISEGTFMGCKKLKRIEIPYDVTEISAHAFRNCTSLRYVTFPAYLGSIGSSAFRNCTSLKSVTISEYTTVDERAFKESPTVILGGYIERDFEISVDLSTIEDIQDMLAIDTSEMTLVGIEPYCKASDSDESNVMLYYHCKVVDGVKVPCIDEMDNSVWVHDSSRLSYGKIGTEEEFLIFLEDVKENGVTKVFFFLDNEKAGVSRGTQHARCFDIDEIMEGFKNGTWTTNTPYELYAKEKEKQDFIEN